MDSERRWDKKSRSSTVKKARREAPANLLRSVRFLYGPGCKLKIGHN
jgi:hypothetical protein